MNVKICFLLLLLCICQYSYSQTLAEELGYKPDDRLLIINCDDVGMCHSANVAVIEGMETGLITSGTIMTPCPWFGEIAAYARSHPEKDFGVHLTHTSEWKFYRWGSVASRESVTGLYDPQGYLWKSIEEVYAHSTPEEALTEGRAQINKAIEAGIPVTHLDSHMGTLQYNPEYMNVYAQLALEFNLPLRMASQLTMQSFGFPGLRRQFKEQGIVFPDYFIYDELENYKEVKFFWEEILDNLKPGVTELYIHASKESEELKAITNSWKVRVQEADLFTKDHDIRQIIRDRNIILIGYRPLMELQRKNRNTDEK
ncbi:MAG TPA: polysaccharide deacetylase family protein [Bacteroidales bacterium]|nr:polysaccharide deacetylase family protein [Bacteroidales bacterium]HPF02136.1 polysaccharide deacetylase family protein [Bacteroidales bacterium]HPJ58139.1 polysaccharide deacetylase family protein [Bacteroidales bacterium]HPR11470.1 polysaccharide deacetylase family protein [Bacteroidales bacterium]HRW84549.1 polysaccharide deacetylase family protein [Bacteroidales bacterium]